MPAILFKNGYRFFFYSNDHLPKHIHVEKENKTAKFHLIPVELIKSSKFTATELRQIRNLVEENIEF
jgi:hypothetical protein